jgi:hypothetical protein
MRLHRVKLFPKYISAGKLLAEYPVYEILSTFIPRGNKSRTRDTGGDALQGGDRAGRQWAVIIGHLHQLQVVQTVVQPEARQVLPVLMLAHAA